MEPPANSTEWIGGLLFGIGTVLAGIFAAWKGARSKPPPEAAANVTLSGALLDNKVVDPLKLALEQNTATNARVADMLERWIVLQEQEYQQEKQKAFQEAVVETALEKLRKEMELNPAPMPKARPRPER